MHLKCRTQKAKSHIWERFSKGFTFLFSFIIAIPAVQAATITLADPTIFFDNGTFYLSGTSAVNEGFALYTSTDLLHWTSHAGKATNGLALSKDDSFGSKNFWAPQIFKKGDMYYMAYAAEEQIAIASAESPAGPFRQEVQQKLPSTTGQIDPYVFIDDDGKTYLYYVRFTGGNQLWVAELNDDMQSIKQSSLTFCLGAASGTWENTTGGTAISEGPTVIKDGKYYYMLYSANDYQNIDYAVGYAYATSPLGPWTKHSEPILSRHHLGQNGTGHGDLFQDAEGNWWYVFHLHASNNAVHSRRTAIVPLTLTGNPDDEFHIDYGRYFVLDDSATPGAKIPEAPTYFQSEGLTFQLLNSGKCSVTFPEGTHFGDYKGHIVIPDSVFFSGQNRAVSEVGHDAFYRCTELTAVTLPATISVLRYAAFDGCTALRDILALRGQAPSVAALVFDSSVYSQGKVWVPENSWSNYSNATGWKAFANISGNPDEEDNSDFTAGGLFFQVVDSAAATCRMVSRNSKYDSYSQSLIEVPATVENGGISWKVVAIGENAFRNCHLVHEVILPESITLLGNNSFKGVSNLKSVSIPSSLTYFSASCFDGCTSLESVAIENLSAWSGSTFVNYTSTPLYLAHDIVMNGEPVTDLVLPDTITTISKYAFSGASIQSVVLPRQLTSLGAYAFSACTGLTEVTLTSGVTTLGAGAFHGCTNLSTVSVEATVQPTAGSTTFTRETKAGTLRVPAGTRDAYLEAPTWKTFANIVEYTPSSVHPTMDEELSTKKIHSEPIYDLFGRRVAYPTRGSIYIQGGRKSVFTRSH